MCWKHDPWPGVEVGTHLLRQEVDANGVFVWMGPQFNLRQHLVGEGVAHHKARVAHGTAQVDQPALSQHDDATPILQPVAVHLGLDVHLLHSILIQPLDINLYVKVSNVTHDGIILHLLKVPMGSPNPREAIRDKEQPQACPFLCSPGPPTWHLPAKDDFDTACGSDKDVALLTGLVHGSHLIACADSGRGSPWVALPLL